MTETRPESNVPGARCRRYPFRRNNFASRDTVNKCVNPCGIKPVIITKGYLKRLGNWLVRMRNGLARAAGCVGEMLCIERIAAARAPKTG